MKFKSPTLSNGTKGWGTRKIVSLTKTVPLADFIVEQ